MNHYIGVELENNRETGEMSCFISVIGVESNDKDFAQKLHLVDLVETPKSNSFKFLADCVLKVKDKYKANIISFDKQGIGVGLEDALIYLGCKEEDIYSAIKGGRYNEDILNVFRLIHAKKTREPSYCKGEFTNELCPRLQKEFLKLEEEINTIDIVSYPRESGLRLKLIGGYTPRLFSLIHVLMYTEPKQELWV